MISELVLRQPLFPGRGEFDMLQKAAAGLGFGGKRMAKWRIPGISLGNGDFMDQNDGMFSGFFPHIFVWASCF